MAGLWSDDVFYQALLDRDAGYEGIFVAAIKTTGIFCRPTCNARKPRRGNVEFFPGPREAMAHGYRPCKVCRPLLPPGEPPPAVKALLAEIEAEPSLRVKDADLVRRGIDPSTLRRWFMKNYRMTFHAYQRSLRMNATFKKIRKGESVAAAAFGSGYESLSGFTGGFKAMFGSSPANSAGKGMIDLARIETPLGIMTAGAVEEGICLLEFEDTRVERHVKALEKRLSALAAPGENRHFQTLKKELAEYFQGKLKTFGVPLRIPGTEFQRAAWLALQNIPYGETRSYAAQAAAIGKPKAVRAVALANNANRISVVIPCHRVIGSDGNLTGYGGGLWRKKWLLDLERKFA